MIASARWHTQGRRIVYLASNPASALLEVLVHLEVSDATIPDAVQLLKIGIPEDVSVERLGKLDEDWADDLRVTRAIGDRWLPANRSALLFGRNTVFREPQRTDMRNDRLEEDFSNLGLFLSRLRKAPKAKAAIIEGLRDLYDGFTDFETVIEGGAVQVFFTEGGFSFPATRLSDGSLRYLCLLAILCDPSPPPLICIEEPELGLHPDILPKLADLLVQASGRTQLIVTTHSDVLVDALTDSPESVVVCEKHERGTVLRRLEQAELGHGWRSTVFVTGDNQNPTANSHTIGVQDKALSCAQMPAIRAALTRIGSTSCRFIVWIATNPPANAFEVAAARHHSSPALVRWLVPPLSCR